MAKLSVRGKFVWHDLFTPNRAGAQQFYGDTVGWKTESWEADKSYLMFAAKSGPVGGVTEEHAATPHWLPYISTSNVDETTEAATGLGARVQTPPTSLPNGGRFAMVLDPQGTPFGVYSSSADDDGGGDAAPQAGEFSWHELATTVAPNDAFGFYAALFAWDEISQFDMGPMGMYLIFGRNGRQLGGMFNKGEAGKPGNPYWLGYVSVTDLEGTIERAKAARGSVLTGPMDVPGGDRIATLMDPYGAFFALHKPAGRATTSAGGEQPARKAAKPVAAKKPPARRAAAKKKPVKKKTAKPAARKKAKPKPVAKKKRTAAKKAAKPKAKAKAKKKAGKAKRRR